MQGTRCTVRTVHLRAANGDSGALQQQVGASQPCHQRVAEGEVRSSPASHGCAKFNSTFVRTACQSCAAHCHARPAAANSVCRLQKQLQPPSPQKQEHAEFSCRQQHVLPRGCTGCMASPALHRDNAKAVILQHTSSGGRHKGWVPLYAALRQRRSSWGQWPSQLYMWCRGADSSLPHPD